MVLLENKLRRWGDHPDMPAPLGDSKIDISSELARAMGKIYLSIIKVNLDEDRAFPLYSQSHPENVGHEYQWKDYLGWYGAQTALEDREYIKEQFSSAGLIEQYHMGKELCTKDFSFIGETDTDWMTILAFLYSSLDGTHFAYVMIRHAGEDQLLRSIIDMYVYNTCDYFIYLDAKNNRYTMFSGSTSGTPLPPAVCEDYEAEIVKYAEEFVVPEDKDMVIREMGLSRVLDVLSDKEVHSIYCGVIDPVLGYTRKRLDYRCHNKEKQMILLSRTDVTDVYMVEQKNHQMLQDALTLAQTDSLTGLLNYQGTVDKITDSLSNTDDHFALLFIDLDNFKGINDTLGHAAGDELLRHIAEVLRTNTRASDLVGRVGGDEFVVFIRWTHSQKEVEACAQRLCDGIQAISFSGQDTVPTSCSIGVALFPEDGTDYKSLVQKADRLVYKAKMEGKGRFSMQ